MVVFGRLTSTRLGETAFPLPTPPRESWSRVFTMFFMIAVEVNFLLCRSSIHLSLDPRVAMSPESPPPHKRGGKCSWRTISHSSADNSISVWSLPNTLFASGFPSKWSTCSVCRFPKQCVYGLSPPNLCIANLFDLIPQVISVVPNATVQSSPKSKISFSRPVISFFPPLAWVFFKWQLRGPFFIWSSVDCEQPSNQRQAFQSRTRLPKPYTPSKAVHALQSRLYPSRRPSLSGWAALGHYGLYCLPFSCLVPRSKSKPPHFPFLWNVGNFENGGSKWNGVGRWPSSCVWQWKRSGRDTHIFPGSRWRKFPPFGFGNPRVKGHTGSFGCIPRKVGQFRFTDARLGFPKKSNPTNHNIIKFRIHIHIIKLSVCLFRYGWNFLQILFGFQNPRSKTKSTTKPKFSAGMQLTSFSNVIFYAGRGPQR